MGDELLLNFGAKFQRLFVISHVKLQNCHKGSGNYKDLDKTRVKLFPNFTRHHLITQTYFVLDNQKASKNTFGATTFKVEENSRTFQGFKSGHLYN